MLLWFYIIAYPVKEPKNINKILNRRRKLKNYHYHIQPPFYDNLGLNKNDQRYNARNKFQRAGNPDDLAPRKFGAKFTEYARLNALRSQILMDIEKDKDFKWPRPIKYDPEKRNQNMYCK